MFAGHLDITGEIDVARFWPVGESDGDTAHLSVGHNVFRFRASPGHTTMTAHAFDHAVGAHEKPLIHDGRITIRLQGIDAPELHYSAQLKGTETSATTRESSAASSSPSACVAAASRRSRAAS